MGIEWPGALVPFIFLLLPDNERPVDIIEVRHAAVEVYFHSRRWKPEKFACFLLALFNVIHEMINNNRLKI